MLAATVTGDQPGNGQRIARSGWLTGIALMLAACGGGSGGSDSGGTGAAASTAAAPASPAIAAAGGSTAATQPASGTPAGALATPAGTSALTPLAADLLARVNAIRASAHDCGTTRYPAAGPLTWNSQAEDAARTQALYLQGNNLFSHTGANGSSVGDRLTAAGYTWSTVGENIAAGYADAATVIAGWLASPGHCANMSNAAFADLGVVLQPGTSANTYGNYWVMVVAHAR